MPVPVPFVARAPACPSRKHHNLGNSLKIHSSLSHHGRALSLSSANQPLAHNSFHPWARYKDRESDHRPVSAVERRDQGFRLGLAGATDAPAIKGARAEACSSPLFTFTPNGAMEESADVRPWTARDLVNQEPPIESCDDTQLKGVRGWSSTPNLCLEDEPGPFAPLLEDDSSDLVNGELGSSPLEPLTPFGEYVDRAVATSDATTIYDPLVSASPQERLISIPSACGSEYSHHQSYTTFAVKEGTCHGGTRPPSATLTYKRFAEPMAEWVVTYVWKVCTNGIALPQSIGHYAPPSAAQPRLPVPLHLTNAVHSLLMSTLLQPSAVLLALWYIARLPVFFGVPALGPEHVKERRFRVELHGDCRNIVDGESAEGTATFRLIVLGFMLANKWLDDHTFSNKTWHTISNVPIQLLNRLEYLALDILSHDLSVSPIAWSEWLKYLLSYHHSLSPSVFPQPISRPSSSPRSVIRSTIQQIMEAPLGHPSDEPVFLGVDQRPQDKFGFSTDCDDADSFDIDLDEDGPLREEYLPKRRASDGNSIRRISPDGSSSLPFHHQSSDQSRVSLLPPAEWNAIGDEMYHLGNHVRGIYVPAHSSFPTRYIAPAPVMYQAWTAVPTTYLPLADGECTGNYLRPSHNPCWCPPAQSHAPQQAPSGYCADLYRASNCRDGEYSHGTFDRSCGEARMTMYGTSYPTFTTTSWVLPKPYGYVPSRQPLGPHPSVNYQSTWLRA
ncbi:hypothetical protein J3A83DRAFT_2049804 [Scleroderma citrinum]